MLKHKTGRRRGLWRYRPATPLSVLGQVVRSPLTATAEPAHLSERHFTVKLPA